MSTSKVGAIRIADVLQLPIGTKAGQLTDGDLAGLLHPLEWIAEQQRRVRAADMPDGSMVHRAWRKCGQ